MNRLLERADPARAVEIDGDRLRALVDDRIGLEPIVRPQPRRSVRPLIAVAGTFAIVMAVALPALLNGGGVAGMAPSGQVSDFPGLVSQTGLASGGVQTMAIDGDDIWVVTSLQNVLQRISRNSNRMEETFDLDAYVEGVIAGDGHLWLLSYGNDGEVLRFDPAVGIVDLKVPLGGMPRLAWWYEGRLFAGNDQGEYLEIAADGTVLSTNPGVLLGEGLGLLWVFEETGGSIQSLSSDGTRGQYVIPGSTPEFGDLGLVRGVVEAGGYLWLTFGEHSESIGRFDPSNGELQPLHVGRWLRSATEHDGALWMTSYSDHLLFRVDPETGEVRRFPLPGRTGGVQAVGGDLGVLLYQPGVLVRIDPTADLLEMGPEVASATFDPSGGGRYTLACTLGGANAETLERVQVDGDFTALEPTIVLEGPSWQGVGIWSMIQASIQDRVVCASGRMGEAGTPQERAGDLASALDSAGVPGPYQLVASGDAVHTIRLFADGGDDISGVVLVEPMPLGFQDFYDGVLADDWGHPPWLDIDPAVSDSLADFGSSPLVILSHDPRNVFLTDRFVEHAGEETSQALSDYWEDGMDFYAGLSSNSRRVSVPDAGFEGVIWSRPDLIVDSIVEGSRLDG